MLAMTALLSVLTIATDDGAPLRREADCRFAIDERFQRAGGVQLFYAFKHSDDRSERLEKTFVEFRPLDFNDRFDAISTPTHVVMSRLVHTVNKDVSFFSEQRVVDLEYMRAIAPDMKVSKRADGRFRVGAVPQNDFEILHFGPRDVQALLAKKALSPLLVQSGAVPTSIVVQENTGFSRVMGMRTAEMGVTWTAHYAVNPGVTRVEVTTMSYIHTVPPFFLGGSERVYKESVSAAVGMIRRLREFRDQ